jgi:pimeloyl-ACP methyl ester carboxylesterase
MVFDEPSVDDLDDDEGLLMRAFFTQGAMSKSAGRAYIERARLRMSDRDASVSKLAAIAEPAAIREWASASQTSRFAMLGRIRHPTLIIHGSKDHNPSMRKPFLQHATLFLNGS